jgi:hypothetical protein
MSYDTIFIGTLDSRYLNIRALKLSFAWYFIKTWLCDDDDVFGRLIESGTLVRMIRIAKQPEISTHMHDTGLNLFCASDMADTDSRYLFSKEF